ncbi:translation initiation factor IF-2 [Streptomyces roseoverticillatus]|uniref:translation initiation factor IF-2 n=1 Tax=Streptomyces roseoverticillatus TaxID=66429 RepID=UPI0033F553D8
MSATTVSRTATASVVRRPRAPGITWVVWRQHRTAAWIALAVLAALCAELLWLRGAMTGYVAEHGLAVPCRPEDDCAAFTAAVDGFRLRYGDFLGYNVLLLEFLPLFAGVFVAGPVIARELESGTYKVAWTQSVSPARWFAAKLGLPVAALLVGASVLSAVFTWTWRPVGHLDDGLLVDGTRWYEAFDALGPAPVAGVLSGAALGALTGLLVKRTLPAMAGTAAACVLLYWPLTTVRPYLADPVTTTRPASADYPPSLHGGDSWRYERGMTTPAGGRLPDAGCIEAAGISRCVTRHGADGWYLDSHPPAHFRRLEWAQAGLVTAAAGACAAGALWRVRRLCA